jgi:hypothetical protein
MPRWVIPFRKLKERTLEELPDGRIPKTIILFRDQAVLGGLVCATDSELMVQVASKMAVEVLAADQMVMGMEAFWTCGNAALGKSLTPGRMSELFRDAESAIQVNPCVMVLRAQRGSDNVELVRLDYVHVPNRIPFAWLDPPDDEIELEEVTGDNTPTPEWMCRVINIPVLDLGDSARKKAWLSVRVLLQETGVEYVDVEEC